eukprot:s690_g28.t1
MACVTIELKAATIATAAATLGFGFGLALGSESVLALAGERCFAEGLAFPLGGALAFAFFGGGDGFETAAGTEGPAGDLWLAQLVSCWKVVRISSGF